MDYSPFSPTAGAVAYWLFIGVAAALAMLSPYLRQREVQKTLRKAIEAGQTLDPAMLERMQARPQRSPEGIICRGLILIALGPGLWIMGYCIGLENGRPNYSLSGAGALVALIGVALTGFGIWLLRRGPRAGG